MGTWNPGPGATVGVDTFTGDGTGENADGLAGNDTLNGNGGDDTLRGNAGVDTISGGDNNDTLIIVDGDEAAGETYAGGAGTDTLQVSGHIEVTDDAFTVTSIEAITIVDNATAFNVIEFSDLHFAPGGIASNVAVTTYANIINDVISVTIRSGDHADFNASGWVLTNFLPGDHINLWGAIGDNTITGTNFNDWLRGLDGADTLFGGAGNDDLRGDEVADGDIDTLSGGAGNDYYVLSEAHEIVIEAPGEGDSDTVYSVAAYTLTDNVENLYLDPLALTGTGNNGANFLLGSTSGETLNGLGGNDQLQAEGGGDTLNGGEGNDHLDGGSGIDSMFGGDGDDTYIVTDVGDATTEVSALGGTDLVQSSITRTLGANLENLTLTGAAAITGYGNALDNIILGNGAANTMYGYDGSDTLDGGVGADIMYGGNGNDFYVVDNSGDVTTEASALGGLDTVVSSVNRNLSANLENLILTGSATTGSGNILDNDITGTNGANTLYGFEGDDYLEGLGGADTLFGANGNDTYIVDDVNDITVESSPSGGVDTVQSWISRNLNANFENMLLLGTAATAYGNVLANVLTGNDSANNLYGFDGADTLNGGAGADQMFGADGDDTYFVDNTGDVTSEVSALGGIDTVNSSVERNLTANIENLVLTGSVNINGSGNALNNNVTGNSGVNTLYGLGGDDTLNGGLGADTLQGGPGADSYAFTTALGASNVDTIVGFNVADDTIILRNSIFGLPVGTLAANAFVIGAAAADADDRIIYNSATGALSYDADGNGGGAAVQFATLAAGLALTNNDFLVSGP